MNNTREIDIYSLNTMPIEQIINLYKQGYKISPSSLGNQTATAPVKLRSMATCQATTKTVGQVISLSATPSGGTPPYTVDFLKDGAVINTTTHYGIAAGQVVTDSYTPTSADVGSHIFGAKAYDSCPGNPQASAIDSCTVNITSTPPPSTAGYNCASPGNCQYVTSNAQYADLATCQASCTSGGGAGYNCVSPGNCQYVTSNAQYSTQSACQTACPAGGGGGGGLTCSPPCTSTQICLVGSCVEKKYLTYGAIGFGALLLLSVLK